MPESVNRSVRPELLRFCQCQNIDPFALSLSKGRAVQILTKPKGFLHHEAFGYMLRQAQHERFPGGLSELAGAQKHD